ncbi:MAG: ROK family protein [Prevotella sp.]|nr:ROK family protein [Prevotella sp.]
MEQTTVKKRVVGVDISLKATIFAIVDTKGDIIASDSFPTKDYPDINNYVTTLSDRIMGLVEMHGGYESIRSVGISAPSGNFMTGCIENSPNMPWKGVIPLAALLRDRLGLAVALANNATVSALGEHAFGCAHGMRDFVEITLGTGMGSCFFSNGMIHKGFDGFAGEIGHTCVEKNGRLCGCGNKGCLEQYTATKGIVLTAKEVLAETDKPSLMRQDENLTPESITRYCEEGDELAIEVYRRTGMVLGLGLANYASIVNPEAFILTGGIAKAGKWLLEPTRESFEEHVFHNIQHKTKILLSDLDVDQHDVLGASVLAWEVREYSLFK